MKAQPKPKGDSRCLLCGHIEYGKAIEKCPKCKGLCRLCPPDELYLSGRHNIDGW